MIKTIALLQQSLDSFQIIMQEYIHANGQQLTVRECDILTEIVSLQEQRNNITSIISKRLNITKAAISIAIKKLEKKGYLYRYHSIDDRRKVYVTPTKKTIQFIDLYNTKKTRVLETLFIGLNSKEQNSLNDMLQSIIKNGLVLQK
jgi:DNA-binding MarR family transcriptional regulator